MYGKIPGSQHFNVKITIQPVQKKTHKKQKKIRSQTATCAHILSGQFQTNKVICVKNQCLFIYFEDYSITYGIFP